MYQKSSYSSTAIAHLSIRGRSVKVMHGMHLFKVAKKEKWLEVNSLSSLEKLASWWFGPLYPV